MPKIVDKDGKEISLSEYCKGLESIPKHWQRLLDIEAGKKPAPKAEKQSDKGGDK